MTDGGSLEERLARLTAAAAKNLNAAKQAARDSANRAASGEAVDRAVVRPPTPRPEPAQPPARTTSKYSPTSWLGALILMCGLAAVLFVVEGFDAANGHQLDRFGIRPRQVDGLFGIVASPFLHASWWHLISNTVPFVLLGWALLLSGVRNWLTVTAIVVFVGGTATWLIAPTGVIVGASGLIFGWLGYLLARAFFARRLVWIAAAVFIVFFFSSLFGGLLPSLHSNVSWQAHICGFAAGVLAGWLLHPRKPARSSRSARRPSVS